VPPHARAGQDGRGHRFAAYRRCSTDPRPSALVAAGGKKAQAMNSERAVSWRSTVITAGVHSVVQMTGLALAMLAWRGSPGWTSGEWFLYCATLAVVTPVLGRVLARAVLRLDHPLQAWRVWAVGVLSAAILVFGEGFAEARVAPQVVLGLMGTVAFFGGLASSWPAKESRG
jgi:hypothetical protein